MLLKKLLLGILGVWLACLGSYASAQGLPTRDTSSFLRGIAPASPVAGQPFVLNIFSGECEFLAETRTGAHIHSIVGNVVTIYVDGIPNVGCNWPTGERQYDLPGIPTAGEYQFHVYFVPTLPGGESETIGALIVSVAAPGQQFGSPLTVPATDVFMLMALGCLVSLGALASRRGH